MYVKIIPCEYVYIMQVESRGIGYRISVRANELVEYAADQARHVFWVVL